MTDQDQQTKIKANAGRWHSIDRKKCFPTLPVVVALGRLSSCMFSFASFTSYSWN